MKDSYTVKLLILILFLCYILTGEISKSSENYDIDSIEFRYNNVINPGRWLRKLKVYVNTSNKNSSVLVQIYFPRGYTKGDRLRTIIALPGYRDSYLDWGRETRIESYADKYNFAIVCPNMGRTAYETSFYPETRNKWGPVPGAKFIGEILIAYLRNTFALASARNLTGILGASTGARGAVIIAANYSNLFSVISCFSGLYDHLSMTKNKLLQSVYGDYKKFKERWINDDNILKLAVNLNRTDIFLYHGAHDHTFPKEQSMLFAIKLGQIKKRTGSKNIIKYKEKRYSGHDWKFWNYALSEAMEFFDKYLKEE